MKLLFGHWFEVRYQSCQVFDLINKCEKTRMNDSFWYRPLVLKTGGRM